MKKVLLIAFLLPGPAWALTCVSQSGGGAWSSAATWSSCGGGAPGAGDSATVSSGHTVTVSGVATASAVTVRGILTFDRVASSTLTLTGGDITVKSGGVLDMGTAASPVTGHATLVLAKGSGSTRYALSVESGGSFLSWGASKSPAADAATDAPAGATSVKVSVAQSAGWAAGDAIILGQTEDGGATLESEARVISSLGAGDPRDVNWTGALSYDHVVAGGFRVASLTRNVVVMSSGTNLSGGASGNSAYILNQTPDPLKFQAALTEFVGIGVDGGFQNAGLYMVGGNALISSCTIRSGSVGLQAEGASGSVITGNVFYANTSYAMVLSGGGGNAATSNDFLGTPDNHTSLVFEDSAGGDEIVGNRVYGNPLGGGVSVTLSPGVGGELIQDNKIFRNNGGLEIDGVGEVIVGNEVRGNGDGFHLGGSGGSLVVGNLLSSNALGRGLSIDAGTGNLVGGNQVSGNNQEGIYVGSAGNTFIADTVYGNGTGGVALANGASNTVLAGVRLGFDGSGASSPDAAAELSLAPAGSNESAVLRGAWINATPGISLSGFNKPGNSLASYSPVGAPGTAQVYGDFAPSSALTLDRTQRLLPSRATSPILLRGSGHAVSGITTNDANALSQIVSVRYDGTSWRVEGSSSGFMGNYAVGGGAQSFPAVNPQVAFTFTPGFAAAVEDRVAFGLLAATNDANTRKWLLFGNSASGFNSGKSKLTMAPGVALTLTGTGAEPTVVDRLSGGSTYYTLIASGPVTMGNVTAQDMDASGFQLSGTGGVSLSSVSFDNIGGSGGAYLTLRSLSSTGVVSGMTFNDSGSKSPLSVNVQGVDTGLGWVMAGYSGARSGDSSDFDPNGRIYWSGSTPVGTPGGFTAVGASDGINLSWTAPNSPPAFYRGSYRLYSSTISVAGPFTLRSTPAAGDTGFNDPGLQAQTTYYYRLQATDAGGVGGSSATAAALTGDFALPSVSTMTTAEGRTAGVGWTSAVTVAFNKTMPLGSVQGAVTLRRLSDNLGVATDTVAGVVVAAGAGSGEFTVSPLSPLGGNSLYELEVSTAAADALGQHIAAAASLQFTTLMDHTVRNVAAGGAGGAIIDMPAGALSADGYIQAAAVPAGSGAATQKLVSNTGDALRTPVTGGAVTLQVFDATGVPQALSMPATVTLPYPDASPADGVVDGTQVKAATLAVYWLDQIHGLWVRLPSSVDASARTVSAQTSHLAAFALIGQASTDLSTARAFPVPWRPGAGDLTFTDVGQSGAIEIFTPDGAPVKNIPIGASGQETWDGRNDQGRPVATGVYFYRISGGGAEKRGKLVVVR